MIPAVVDGNGGGRNLRHHVTCPPLTWVGTQTMHNPQATTNPKPSSTDYQSTSTCRCEGEYGRQTDRKWPCSRILHNKAAAAGLLAGVLVLAFLAVSPPPPRHPAISTSHSILTSTNPSHHPPAAAAAPSYSPPDSVRCRRKKLWRSTALAALPALPASTPM